MTLQGAGIGRGGAEPRTQQGGYAARRLRLQGRARLGRRQPALAALTFGLGCRPVLGHCLSLYCW